MSTRRSLVLASNRVPWTVRFERGHVDLVASSGGLANGLGRLHRQARWVGWPGDTSGLNPQQESWVDEQLQARGIVPVHLSRAEIAAYYEGFANGVLWPLLHDLNEPIRPEAWSHWAGFVEVNRRFAEVLVAETRPGDLVWIHDFHLALVPALLRARCSEARIGYFLHTPFPAFEEFRALPWSLEILRGILGADVVGFHTDAYLRQFERALQDLLRLRSDGGNCRHDGREVRLGAFPMGIDLAAFAGEVEPLESEGGRRLVLGVDRLDPSKGIAHRLRAFERLLEMEPNLDARIRFVQVVVPSRGQMYAELRRELEQLVERINASYDQPVRYLYRSVPFEELVALYRAADVMLVTPLRDGMNLVAKEFVAARVDEDGVLVLSEFAGAAAELAEALIVNPFDIQGTAQALQQALEMAPWERRERMSVLRARLRANDVRSWADSFLSGLEGSVSSGSELEILARRAAEASQLCICLDYDGTLVPFASTPEAACPDVALLELLASLAVASGTHVHIISGRTRESLAGWFGDISIGLHAEHGACSWDPKTRAWRATSSDGAGWLPGVVEVMNEVACRTPGSLVEHKRRGAAWHYRMADSDWGEQQARSLVQQLEDAAREIPIRILWSNKAVDVSPLDVDKGRIVEGLRRDLGPETRFLAIGDDKTDEDMFAVLGDDDICVKVGPGAGRARYHLKDPGEVRRLLIEISQARGVRP